MQNENQTEEEKPEETVWEQDYRLQQMRQESFSHHGRVRWLVLCFVVVLGASVIGSAGEMEDRRVAIRRGLNFIYSVGSNDQNLEDYGSDLLWCFYSVWHTSSDRELSESAARMGRELARRWRKLNSHVPPQTTAGNIYRMVLGAYAADGLGVRDPGLKAELREAVRRFNTKDFLGFDAALEPPDQNDNRYDVWSGALITSYFGDAYGVRLGARYRDVLKWMPCLRPYDGHNEDVDLDAFYAVTHVIYTLNRYSERKIAPSLLPDEFAYLRHKLTDAMKEDDPEMVGEALDTLRAAGFENDPEVEKGMEYLIKNQRPDGAWAGDEDDVYTEYHSAWTGIDGLRDYRFRGQITKLPRMGAVRCSAASAEESKHKVSPAAPPAAAQPSR